MDNFIKPNKNNKFILLIACLAFGFAVILFFSKSSPLYFTNDWVDANAFYSVGKGIAHGKVPYKDLFEQKGILLYLFHTIAYKISPTSFFGVYLLEGISFSITLFLFFKIARFYFSKTNAFFITCLTPLFLINKEYFRFGDSAEEFAFPFLLSLLYLIVSVANEEKKIKGVDFFFQGMFMGCVFWIKYTMISPWIAFFLFAGIYYIVQRKFENLLKAIICSLLGYLIVSFPVIIYFVLNHALDDMIFVYFKFNMVLYPQLVNQSVNVHLLSRFANTMKIFWDFLSINKAILFITVVGTFHLLFSRNIFAEVKYKILWLSILICTNFFTFYGGIPSGYYMLLNMPILLISFLSFFVLTKFVLQSCKITTRYPELIHFSQFILIGLALIVIVQSNDNYKDLRFFVNRPGVQIKNAENTISNSKEPAQLEFAKYMKGNHISLLNYGFVDYGFSVKPNIVPNLKYFMNVNIPYNVYSESMDEQNKYIEKKKVDFVVAGLGENENPDQYGTPWLHINYKPIAIHVQSREDMILKYVLYKKR